MLHAVLLLRMVWLCLTHTDIHRTVPSCVWRWQRALRHTYPDWVGAVEVGAGRALESSLRGDGIRADWLESGRRFQEQMCGHAQALSSTSIILVQHKCMKPLLQGYGCGFVQFPIYVEAASV